MKTLTLFLIIIIPFFCLSQCLSGNCKDGFGKYDYGYATYQGLFKNEKPNGLGTMDYGAGEKFVGNFTNGQEDGEGQLFKKNVPTNVTYINGKAKIREKQVAVGSNAPTVSGCEKGDCYNGFGIVQFPSGNRYEGNFVYGVKSGEGKFYYASGNVFSGNFEDNTFAIGIFKYAQEQITFDGNYNDDGSPKTGKYYYATNKATVLVENGKITKVDNPVARRADSLAVENSKPRSCSKCGGTGMCAGITRMVTRENFVPIHYVDRGGNLRDIQFGNVMKSASYETSYPTKCNDCNGTGQLVNRGMIINTGRY